MRKAKVFILSGLIGTFMISASAYAQESPKSGTISFEEFKQSRAAKLFKMGSYEEALQEFQKMSEEYPEDTLPRRYVGMTQILTGRLDEAISTFQETLETEPDNPALHYYLARAYHEQGAEEKAKAELDEVLRLDPKGFYGEPTREALPSVTQRKLVPKPWDIWAAVGYEYDSNVTEAPNDKALRGTADESAGRYYLSLGGKYKWLQRGRFDSYVGYRLYKSLHDDSLDEFNFTFNEFFFINEYWQNIRGKEVHFGLRYALPFSFLGGNTFSFASEITAYVNSRLTKNTFTEVYHRWSHIEFGRDGAIPNLTSRDGEYNTTGIHHRFYFSELSRYVFVGYEIHNAATEGNNFDRFGQSFHTGFHTPLVKKLSLDVIGSFWVAHYPHYSAEIAPIEPLARRDNDWTLLVTLTYELTRNWSLRGFYRYGNSNNRNDLYQHDRHIGGTEILFRY